MPSRIKDYLPDLRRLPADWLLGWVLSMIASAFGTWWVATASNAPNITSVGWLVIFVALMFVLLALLAVAGWVAGLIRRQWRGGLAANPAAETTQLIDPFLAAGGRTYASVFIDTNNWRARIIKKSNIFEVAASFMNADRTAVKIVVIFEKWTFERGAVITTDNRLATYRTSEDAMTERYAIYSIQGIQPPCVIDIEFQSSPTHPQAPAEPLPLASEPEPRPALPAPRQMSAYEVEKKLRAIDEFLDFLNTEMRPTVDQGNRVRDLAWEIFQDRERNASYQQEMEAHIRMVRSNFDAFERLRGLYPQYPDIVAATEQRYGVKLESTATDYMREFALLLACLKDNTPKQHFSEIMSAKRAAFDDALNAFRVWRQKTAKALAELRRTLAP